jgi:hypothetical protein
LRWQCTNQNQTTIVLQLETSQNGGGFGEDGEIKEGNGSDGKDC